MARFISPNSAEAGSSNFAAIVVFALIVTGSDVAAGWPDAGGSIFAAIVVGFALLVSRWTALSPVSADDGFSVFAIVDLTLVVAELALSDAGFGSIGRLAAVLSKQANPFASVHASMLACGDKGQLQPTKVAANAPTRSVLMQSSLEAEFRSHFLLRDDI
jgi:hypothetical protein